MSWLLVPIKPSVASAAVSGGEHKPNILVLSQTQSVGMTYPISLYLSLNSNALQRVAWNFMHFTSS